MNNPEGGDMTRSILIVALALPLAIGNAQVTITAADVGVQLTPGNTLTNREDTQTKSVNVGEPGATSWDFSGLLTDTVQVLTSVSAASTPYIGDFPSATHALQTDVSYEGITATLYQYLRLATNFENVGSKASVESAFGTLALTTTNAPNEIVYGLPCTLGTTWTSTHTSTQTVTIGIATISTTVTAHNARYLVDAYGPMTLPGSYGTHQALRIRKIDTIQKDQNPPYTALSYNFIAANGASVLLTACDTLALSGVIPLCGGLQWSAPINTDVQVADALPKEIRLHQNYPNPFNPVTTIGYELPAKAYVTLKVYDILGREMAVLANGVQEPGFKSVRFDAAGLASGVYMYRLQAGDVVATKRLLVLR
jgi:hypothetical protein